MRVLKIYSEYQSFVSYVLQLYSSGFWLKKTLYAVFLCRISKNINTKFLNVFLMISAFLFICLL